MNTYRSALLELLGMNLEVTKAQGAYLYQEDGREILDCLSQYGVMALGHNPPEVVDRLTNHLAHGEAIFSQPLHQSTTELLTKKLLSLHGEAFAHICYANSGAEAVEAAIKLARLRTRRKKILSLREGFHGKTFTALSATGSTRYKSSNIFDAENFQSLDPRDIQGLESALNTGDYAAVIVEPVQGEGGMKPIEEQLIQRLSEVARSNGTLLIADEIQCGLGRCGEMSLSLHCGVKPDMLLYSKALGGGVAPIACVLYKSRVYCREFEKKHSSTFSGNGLGATAALAFLDAFKANNLVGHVRSLSKCVDLHIEYLHGRFPELLKITGLGLMRGLHFSDPKVSHNYLMGYAFNSGAMGYVLSGYLFNHESILTMPLLGGRCTLRFEPPLNVTFSEIDRFFVAIERTCKLIEKGRYDELFRYILDAGAQPSSEVDAMDTYPVSDPSQPLASINYDSASGKKFAFLMHVPAVEDVINALPVAMHACFSQDQQREIAGKFMEIGRIDPSPAIAIHFGVKAGREAANGMMIFSPMSAKDMLKLSPHDKTKLLEEYIDIARNEGVQVIGLGAYTSVISRGGKDIAAETADLTLTTGNSLTAMTVVQQALSEVEPKNRESAVVIGARGSVGRIVTLGLSGEFSHLTLTGRPGTSGEAFIPLLRELLELAAQDTSKRNKGSVLNSLREIYIEEGQFSVEEQQVEALLKASLRGDAPIQIKGESEEALKNADLVASATSAGKPFLDPKYLKPSAVAIDASRPFDFKPAGLGQARIIEGGLVEQPQKVRYGDCNMSGTPTGINLACLSETIILALTKAEGHFGIGESISYTEAQAIFHLGRSVGFGTKPVEEVQLSNQQSAESIA